MKKILVFGKSGQLARALQKSLDQETLFIPREFADFEAPESVINNLNLEKPQIVINAVAYTAVDKAELEIDRAMKINAETPLKIAEWCATNGALLIHFSTEYVYQGDGANVQNEGSPLGPRNAYGLSKLRGEQLIESTAANYLILRTSWVYDETGNNFVKTMLRLGAARAELKIVCDQIGSPSYAADLAQAVAAMIPKIKLPIRETYNICGSGFTSWYDFAKQIFLIAKEKGFSLKVNSVLPIPSSEYKTPAERPLNSRISTAKLKRDFDLELPPWEKSLRTCIGNMESL